MGELPLLALNVDKGPVSALFVQFVQRFVELGRIIHARSPFGLFVLLSQCASRFPYSQ
jgi:hypothetical protein